MLIRNASEICRHIREDAVLIGSFPGLQCVGRTRSCGCTGARSSGLTGRPVGCASILARRCLMLETLIVSSGRIAFGIVGQCCSVVESREECFSGRICVESLRAVSSALSCCRFRSNVSASLSYLLLKKIQRTKSEFFWIDYEKWLH